MASAIGAKAPRYDTPRPVRPPKDMSPEAVAARRLEALKAAKDAGQLDPDQIRALDAELNSVTAGDIIPGQDSKEITVRTRRGPTTMRVRVGEMVLFYAEANLGATPGIAYVQAFSGTDQLTLMVCKGSDMNGGVAQWVIRKNVRHISNEAAQSPNMRRHGAWCEIKTSLHEAVEALEDRVATLLEVVDELTNRLAAVEGK